jgi:hypothetical protein
MRQRQISKVQAAVGLACCLGLWALGNPSIAVKFIPPQQGLPGRRVGGGTRGPQCLVANGDLTSVVALIPQTNLGLTSGEKPTLYWYLPKPGSATVAEFQLYDTDISGVESNLIHQAQIPLQKKAGIVSLEIPTPLKVNQTYYMALSVVCNPSRREQDIVVDGWLRRVELNSSTTQQLAQASPSQKLTLMARQGLWFDVLAALASLRSAQPDDAVVNSDWQELLDSVGLKAIASQPLL